MAQAATATDDDAKPKDTLGKLLKEVTKELNKFEAKKLSALKSELEAFSNKRAALVDDYAKAHPKLLADWNAQHEEVCAVEAQMRKTFSDAQLRWLVREYVHPPRHDLRLLEYAISTQRSGSHGRREAVAQQEATKVERAKARLDAVLNNARRIAAALTDVDKLSTQVRDMLGERDRAVTVYLFWFKLRPLHVSIAPDEPVDAAARRPVPDAADKLSELEEAGAVTSAARSWLMLPELYEEAIDDAWLAYCAARDQFAEAEARFKGDPDDIASLEKSRDMQAKSLDGRIEKALASAPLDLGCAGAGNPDMAAQTS